MDSLSYTTTILIMLPYMTRSVRRLCRHHLAWLLEGRFMLHRVQLHLSCCLRLLCGKLRQLSIYSASFVFFDSHWTGDLRIIFKCFIGYKVLSWWLDPHVCDIFFGRFFCLFNIPGWLYKWHLRRWQHMPLCQRIYWGKGTRAKNNQTR